jgi:hypothetical protein
MLQPDAVAQVGQTLDEQQPLPPAEPTTPVRTYSHWGRERV